MTRPARTRLVRAPRPSGVRTAARARAVDAAAVASAAAPLHLAVLFVLASTSTGCWPGWTKIFDQTPSREHRVEDLRVLAVQAEPASLVLPGSFFFDEAEPAPLSLHVVPRVFDPRGGQVDVRISLCSPTVSFQPCSSERAPVAMPSFSGAFDADENKPLGEVNADATLSLTRAQVLALFAEAKQEVSAAPLDVRIVVDVGRTFDGRRENESATLDIQLQLDPFDPGLSADHRAQLIDDAHGLDCGDAATDCFPGGGDGVPVCGNGVVEPGEDCDPPKENVCDETCFTIDFCAVAPPPACVLRPVVNTAPVLLGVRVGDDGSADPTTFDVAPGGVIAVPIGVSTTLAPALVDSFEQFQGEAFGGGEFGCQPDSPGAVPALGCGGAESTSWRVYIEDGKAELTAPADDVTGAFFGNSQLSLDPFSIAFAEGTAPGTQEPLAVVLSDGRGGMDLELFTIEAR